jgi:murein DD-endopeptidase MepM/ murein hydrolase activator NlpD
VYAYGTVVYRGNGDPGQPTATGTYAFVLPRSSIQTEYWLTKTHHDYPAADIPVGTGTPMYAVTAGRVTHTSATGSCGLGYILAGNDGVTYTYCHGNSRAVASGATVTAGQYLGTTGNTGNSSGPHLHFQVRFGVLRCPQNMLLALYRNAPVPDPKTLPTSGCTH